MSRQKAAALIAKKVKELSEKGVSLRDIEDEIDVSSRTIRRYMNGEFPAEVELAEDLMKYLFKDAEERDQVRGWIESVSNLSKNEIRKRNKFRKALTKASSTFRCKVGVEVMKHFSKEFNARIKEIEKEREVTIEDYLQLRSEMDLGEHFVGLEIWVDFFSIRLKYNQPVLRISSEENISFVYDPLYRKEENLKGKQASSVAEHLRIFSKRFGVDVPVILGLAERGIENSSLLNQETNDKVLLDQDLLGGWKKSLNIAMEKLAKNNRQEKAKAINSMRYIESDLKFFEKQYEEVNEAKEKFSKFINSLHSLFPL